MHFAVIKTGGKQYLVSEGEEIYIEHLAMKTDSEVEFATLARGDGEKNSIELGKPELKKKARGKVLTHLKGDKIRVARFLAKSRYRKVKGFRHQLTKVKITAV